VPIDPSETSPSSLIATAAGSADLRPTVELLREVPEEEVWLQGQRSEQTRRAYKADIRHFIESLGIRSRDELRQVDRAAVIHWQRVMEGQGARPRTIRRRLSALSSLFTHLVSRRLADVNPCREVKRPRVSRTRGETKSGEERLLLRELLNRLDLRSVHRLLHADPGMSSKFARPSRHAFPLVGIPRVNAEAIVAGP
jgi:integrase family protein with SAM-like domain